MDSLFLVWQVFLWDHGRFSDKSISQTDMIEL